MTVTVDIPRDERAPATARDALRHMDAILAPEVVGDMTLLVSELVTNSVKYGAEGNVRIEVELLDEDRVRVAVVDSGDPFDPAPRTRPATEPGGWGLHLVDELSDRWGVHDRQAHVWFEMCSRRAAA